MIFLATSPGSSCPSMKCWSIPSITIAAFMRAAMTPPASTIMTQGGAVAAVRKPEHAGILSTKEPDKPAVPRHMINLGRIGRCLKTVGAREPASNHLTIGRTWGLFFREWTHTISTHALAISSRRRLSYAIESFTRQRGEG